MGMYDEFILKIPIQCRNCYTGAFKTFQTKDLDCCLDMYREGKPAVAYYWREINDEEKKKRRETNLLFHPSIIGTPMEELCGMLTDDKEHPRKTLGDGIYWAYAWCPNCKDFTYVPMEVKDGIFIGVAQKV